MVVRLVDWDLQPDTSLSKVVREPVRWKCSFVNNMPDGAFEATEHQFLDLLAIASGEEIVEVRRYTMSGIVRSSSIERYVEENYRTSSDIRAGWSDVLIVTGSNPAQECIEAEPYWDELSDLIRWASVNVSSMLLSCLAAHAALLIFDGINRERLNEKCTGVFRQTVNVEQALGAGIGPHVLLPHSRINTVDIALLREHGYSVIIESPRVGWSVATKMVDRCELVLVQAHPEYEPSSLLREYRRDARRYVAGERDQRPVLPYRCVGDEDWPRLESLHAALVPSLRSAELMDDYPFEDVGARAPWPWRDTARQLYANWLSGVPIEKGDTYA